MNTRTSITGLNQLRKLPVPKLAVLLVLFGLGVSENTWATVRYVDVNSANPTPPYTTWATAARVIQAAVDVAAPGDDVVVTNGTYATGGKAVYGTMTNRVAVDKPLTLRSVNGPEVTIIQGYQVPGTTNGDGAIRCVYLIGGASLSGFTITNGATRAAGDLLQERSGGGLWCESTSALVSNCAVAGNSANRLGGGTFRGTLNSCILTDNSANSGGGAYEGTLNGCALIGNTATSSGGGMQSGRLNNCTLTGNSAYIGGGADRSAIRNSIVCFNKASEEGADYYLGTLRFSCVTSPLPPAGEGNISADPQLASAIYLSAASPCRGTGSAAYATGTDVDGEPWAAPPPIGCDEYHAGTATGSLSVRLALAFTNVTAGFPMELTAFIKGRTSSSAWEFGDGVVVSNRPYATHAWAAPGDYAVVLRAYNETHPGGVSATGLVHVVPQPVFYVAAGNSSPLPPFVSWATAATNIQDAVDAASLPPGVGGVPLVLVSNGVYASGGRGAGDSMNRVAADKPLTLRSINGPEFTVIYGGPGFRCVYLADGAILIGFTLTGGFVEYADGGGVWCEKPTVVVSNCVIANNTALRDGGGAYSGTLNNCTLTGNTALAPFVPLPGLDRGFGGGAYRSILNNCTLTNNSAQDFGGGGAYWCELNNCTLVRNRAAYGGGAAGSLLNNCTVIMNSASTYGGGAANGSLKNCTVVGNFAPEGGGVLSCGMNNSILYANSLTNFDGGYRPNFCCTPWDPGGVGNVTNAPLFIDYASGNLRLQSNSPCINAGNNSYAPGATDLDGNPRIIGGTVDIGAYEFQSPASLISYAWLQQYGLPTDGSVDGTDVDCDGLNTWQEWRCSTCPTNALSVLRLLSAMPAGSDVIVSWQSAAGVSYFLERSTNLTSPLFTPLANEIPGQPDMTTYTDTNAPTAPALFYRVGVSE